MDVVDVLLPDDGPRIEGEVGLVGVAQEVEEGEGAVDPVARLGLGVGPVELDVAHGPLGHGTALLELRAEHGASSPQGQSSQDLLNGVDARGGSLELSLDPAATGEGPGRDADGLAAVVIERPLREPLLDELDQSAIAQRVPHAGGDLVDGDLVVGRTVGGHGDDVGDHHVDRDDVDDALGDAGELLEQSARVGDDDRLRHAEAADPAREGLGDG